MLPTFAVRAARHPRLLARALVVAAVLLAPVVLVAPARADEKLPFTDPNAVGSLGFCDAQNRPVTSGDVRDVPFVAKAVSDTAAGKAYAVSGRKAALFATSPSKELDPGLWSPYQMTPSTFYSNAAHPMAAAGFGEPPLEYHVSGTPPTLSGLVQLRLYLSAPNTTPYVQKYPTAVVRVDGDRWVMVAGDRTPDCSAGTAKNINQVLGKGEPTAAPTWAANAVAATAPGSSASPASSGSASAGAVDPSSDASTSSDAGAATSTRSRSVPPVLPIAAGLLLATVAVAVVVVAIVSRRGSARPRRSRG